MLIRFKLGIDRWQGVVFSRILRELIHFVQLFVKLISKGEKEATWKWWWGTFGAKKEAWKWWWGEGVQAFGGMGILL